MTHVNAGKIHLTKREKDCITHLIYGMTSKEIAREMGISHRTVECHLVALKVKMGCLYKSQLITKILRSYAEVSLFL